MSNNNHRYCVIMCGGIGSRFWPYSRQDMPKQFIDFFGTGRSLLQMTYDRILRHLGCVPHRRPRPRGHNDSHSERPPHHPRGRV